MKRVAALPLLPLLLGLAPAAAPPDRSSVPTLTNSVGMRLALVPAGRFLMGSPDDEKERHDDEALHEVEIDRPFFLGAFEVTQEEYRKVTGKSPSYFAASGPGKARVKGLDTRRFPVERVSWDDAVAFCAALSALPAEKAARRRYRLPTEAEWEFACRQDTEAPGPAPFFFGVALSSRDANFNGNFPYGTAVKGASLNRPAPVGSYRAGPPCLFDLHGNVAEWCSDWYDADYYRSAPRVAPQGPPRGDGRIIRGGSWFVHGRLCRAAHRQWAAPWTRASYIGFRVVCEGG
jgi:formylglycine-generating enzyme required for sulfatase activity